MRMLPRLTPKQRQRANALIKCLCANYEDGNCLALDDGEPCACVQSISYSLLCKYFRKAVLPAEPMLEANILGTRFEGVCPAVRRSSRRATERNTAEVRRKSLQNSAGRDARRNGQSRKIGAEKASHIKAFQFPHFEGQGVDTFIPRFSIQGRFGTPRKGGKMAKIKTRDVVKGTIKKIDKAAIAADRMSSAYVQTKEKANTPPIPKSTVPRNTPPTASRAA